MHGYTFLDVIWQLICFVPYTYIYIYYTKLIILCLGRKVMRNKSKRKRVFFQTFLYNWKQSTVRTPYSYLFHTYISVWKWKMIYIYEHNKRYFVSLYIIKVCINFFFLGLRHTKTLGTRKIIVTTTQWLYFFLCSVVYTWFTLCLWGGITSSSRDPVTPNPYKSFFTVPHFILISYTVRYTPMVYPVVGWHFTKEP